MPGEYIKGDCGFEARARYINVLIERTEGANGMNKPEQYKHILAWGRKMGSDASYIREQQERAAQDNAPLDAIYEERDEATRNHGTRTHKWAVFSDVPADAPCQWQMKLELERINQK